MFKHFVAGTALVAAVACSGNPAPEAVPVNDEDFVSIGYGQQERGRVTGAVNSITRTDLEQQQNGTMEDVIRARVPGAQIISTPGGFNIRLRGPSSITGNINALIVLDGVPLQPGGADLALGSLRPSDVQRIDVLKDGSAAIYGIRGSNGVVVIETRNR